MDLTRENNSRPAESRVEDKSDELLVEHARAGDDLALEALMRRHNQRVFRAARSIVGNDSEAEDVAQEAYVRAFQNLEQFRGEARFSTWLTRIAVHEALARARRISRQVELGPSPEMPSENHPPVATPEDRISAGELRHTLMNAIQKLPESLRLVFVLRDVEGLSTGEAARSTGLTQSNVKVKLHRARVMLRDEIDKALGAEVRRLWTFGAERCDRLVAAVLGRLRATG